MVAASSMFCTDLDHSLPAVMCVEQRYDCAFMIKVSAKLLFTHKIINLMSYTCTQGNKFSRSMDITPYKFYDGHEVFILWKWTWLDEVERTHLSRSPSPSLSTTAGDASSDGEEDDSVPEITHSVIFKCIGVHNTKTHSL